MRDTEKTVTQENNKTETNLFPVNTLFWHHYDLTIQFRVIKFNIFVVLSFAPSYVLTQYLLNAYDQTQKL